ncbi:MAG: hypothetical protein KGI97_00730, partial [Alphaproteobacteria bacterium]|nr:hypothetical protein [Alphaproteobacteria bacterium]
LFISVGNGLAEAEQRYKEQNGDGLIDIVLNGNGVSPVEQLHTLLASLADNDNEAMPSPTRPASTNAHLTTNAQPPKTALGG